MTIPTDHHIDVLAMNLWLGLFGETTLRQEWIVWCAVHPAEAQKFKDQAEAMLGIAQSHIDSKAPTPKHHHAHSLGWLFG